jgi:hypothetical protein
MAFLRFTRPDGSPIEINSDQIVSYAAVPEGGPLGGPLSTGTRIVLGGGLHQDVAETPSQVEAIIAAAEG